MMKNVKHVEVTPFNKMQILSSITFFKVKVKEICSHNGLSETPNVALPQ